MPDSSSGPTSKNWVIAVVHGLGTPEPGETREAVCKGIQGVKRDFAPEAGPETSSRDPTFPHQWTFAADAPKVVGLDPRTLDRTAATRVPPHLVSHTQPGSTTPGVLHCG